MEKIVTFLKIITIVVVVFLTGCATTSIGPVNGAYPQTPDGQCIINSQFTIQRFDDVVVNWPSGDGIVIPAGKHTLLYKRSNLKLIVENRSHYIGKELFVLDFDYIPYDIILEVTYEFQEGKKYQILGKSWGDQNVRYNTDTGEITVTEGTQLVFNKDKTFMTILPKVDVSEISSSRGSLFVTPEATGLIGAGLVYGGVTLGQFGERFGIGILGGKMDLKLVGLGQVAMLIPFSGGLPGLQYNFGGLLEYHFPKIGIGAGGGMGGSLLGYEVKNEYGHADGTRWEHELWPYVELNMSIRTDINHRHHVIYFHYYPSWGEEWYKIFGLGYKCNLIN
jgi:hypothetical protein